MAPNTRPAPASDEEVEDIAYHAAQAASYIATFNPSDKNLTSARWHIAKIKALAAMPATGAIEPSEATREYAAHGSSEGAK